MSEAQRVFSQEDLTAFSKDCMALEQFNRDLA